MFQTFQTMYSAPSAPMPMFAAAHPPMAQPQQLPFASPYPYTTAPVMMVPAQQPAPTSAAAPQMIYIIESQPVYQPQPLPPFQPQYAPYPPQFVQMMPPPTTAPFPDCGYVIVPVAPEPIAFESNPPSLILTSPRLSDCDGSTHTPASEAAAQPPVARHTGPRQLIVNFLEAGVTNSELHAAFGKIGPIDSARIIYDEVTRESKGFAFVYYKSAKDAATALACMTGYEMRGQRIKVSLANHRTRRNKPTAGPSPVLV